jgi:tetratricopeptide (TPR) repeat protein
VVFDPAAPENAIYARPADHWKVFVSSKMAGGALKAERAAAVNAIDAFPLTRAWVWERDAVAGPYCSEPECVRQAGTADLFVLILSDELTPVTRLEFEAARAASVPAFVFLQADVERDDDTDAFVALVRKNGITQAFSSPGELATQITRAIRTWALREGRSAVLRALDRTTPTTGAIKGDVDFRDVEVTWTDSLPSTSIRDLLTEAERLVADGKAPDALGRLYEVAQLAWDVGVAWVTMPLLGELERIVPEDAIDARWRGWIENTRGLALSSRGRNEEAVEAFQRMRQIGKALEDADLEGTALQNLGVQDLLAGRHSSARRRFEASVRLKQTISDWRGSIQVLLNFATVLIEQAKLDAAEELFDDVELMLGRARDPSLRNTLHGQRGMLAIARKDYSGAREHFREALRAARRAESAPRQITTMLNLGSVSADLGLVEESRRWYAKALSIAEQFRDAKRIQQTRQALAVALVRCGRFADAARAFEQAANGALALGELSVAAVAFGDAGAAWLNDGDAETATKLTTRALRSISGDDEWRVGQLRNLALALEGVGDAEQGLDRLREAGNLATNWEDRVAVLRQAGELAIAHPALADQATELFTQELDLRRLHESGDRWGWRAAEIGATLNHTSRVTDAPRFFSIALRVFSSRHDLRQVFFIRNDRAIAFAEANELKRATSDLRDCLRIAERLRDRALLQQAHGNLSETQRRRGLDREALAHAEEALRLAEELRDVRSVAEAEGQLGLIASDAGDLKSAIEHLRKEEQLGLQIRDAHIRAMALKGQAAVAVLRGNERGAARLYRRAAHLLAQGESHQQLAESWAGAMLSEATLGIYDPQVADDLYALTSQMGSWTELFATLAEVFARLGDAGADESTVDVGSALILLAVGLASAAEDDEDRLSELSRVALAIAEWTRPLDDDASRVDAIVKAVEQMADAESAAAIAELLMDARGALAEARTALRNAP